MSSAENTKQPQREQAYEQIREALVLQRVAEGERLSEPDWARRLGVSRTAVREAFARLEAEGLIDRAATAGYVVPVLDEADLHEILEVRLALESAAVDRICTTERRSDTDLAPLAEAIEQQATFIEQGYRLGASEADRRFHNRLVELAGNRRLVRMYRRAPLPLIHRLTMPGTPPSPRAVNEHRQILQAIAAGDAALARHLLGEHFRAALPAAMPAINS